MHMASALPATCHPGAFEETRLHMPAICSMQLLLDTRQSPPDLPSASVADHPWSSMAVAHSVLAMSVATLTAMRSIPPTCPCAIHRRSCRDFRLVGALFISRVCDAIVAGHEREGRRRHETRSALRTARASDVGVTLAHGLPAAKVAAAGAVVVIKRHRTSP